jgi:restriction endonuclease Mrr
MPFPKQGDVEIPLLKVLADAGGSAKPRDVYPRVAAHFPNLSVEEQELRLESTPGTRKWWNLVQWVRQHLVEALEIDGSTRGVWRLTDRGRARLASLDSGGASQAGTSSASPQVAGSGVGLRDLANKSRDEAKSRVLTELKNLTPTGFEHFCMELLQQLGYRSVAVTRRSADGGIDGYGDFRQGAVSIKSAFQAKRWTDASVGRPEIDKLRGAIQGDYDHGVFITTSRFTKDATDASYKKGAITILLLDGEAIAELMVERGIGVVRQPVYLYEIAPDFFDFDKLEE